MFPVPDLEAFKIALVQIRPDDYRLFGFLLYSDADEAVVDYMKVGILDLEHIVARECAIFVIEQPPPRWIEIAKKRQSPWFNLSYPDSEVGAQTGGAEFGISAKVATLNKSLSILVREIDNLKVFTSDNEAKTLSSILEPRYNGVYNRDEVWEVVKWFGLSPEQVPTLALFRDPRDDEIYSVTLTRIRTKSQAAIFFRRFFESKQFQELLNEQGTFARSGAS